MYKKQIPVDDLRLGMYVIELDRAWLGTPFDFQGFPVTSEDQIDALKAHCRSVYVDPERQHRALQRPAAISVTPLPPLPKLARPPLRQTTREGHTS